VAGLIMNVTGLLRQPYAGNCVTACNSCFSVKITVPDSAVSLYSIVLSGSGYGDEKFIEYVFH